MRFKFFSPISASLTVLALFVTGCGFVVPEGQVAVIRKFGKFKPEPKKAGWAWMNGFTSTAFMVPINSQNVEVTIDVPSKEGLTINVTVSILYRIRADSAATILAHIGPAYNETVVLPVFRSAMADVCARYLASDLHTSQRAKIEKSVQEQMMLYLKDRGFEVEAVLLKTVTLPKSLTQAIEMKLQAEQQAQEMQFVLEREKREAERKKIEAEGQRDAQRIVNESLNERSISFLQIQAFRELATSPNAKVIITGGNTPFILNEPYPLLRDTSTKK